MSDKELLEWLYLAQGDRETADFLYKESGRPEIIIYHYHQALEKYFKHFLLSNNQEIGKMHFLDKLLSDIVKINPDYIEIKKDVLLINSYLPKLRYPYGDRLFDEDAMIVKEAFFRILNIFPVQKIF